MTVSQDTTAVSRVCVECRETFELTAATVDWYLRVKGLTLPKRCRACRKARRATAGVARED